MNRSTKSDVTKDSNNGQEVVVEKSQFVVITSESLVKVITLPSHNCLHKYALTDSTIAKATVTTINCNKKKKRNKTKQYFFILFQI
jgi:hypothetical protein